MNMTRLSVRGAIAPAVILGMGMSLTAACDGASTGGGEVTDWELVEGNYPYVAEGGATVCREWQRTEHGTKVTKAEFYHFDVLNEDLAGRGSLTPDTIEALQGAGLKQVTTCDQARTFMTIREAFVESLPRSADLSGSIPETRPAVVPLPTQDDGTIDKVANAVVHNGISAVVRVLPWNANTQSFSTCSGVLISRRALLTAAHCFFASGGWNVQVDHGINTACVSQPGTTCPSIPNIPPHANVTRFPGFGGVTDSAHDIAVVVNNANWLSGNKMRLTISAPGEGATFWIDGYGANSNAGNGVGTQRLSNDSQDFDDSFTGYLRATTQQSVGRPCKGDSGGPAINTVRFQGQPDNTLVFGLAQNFSSDNDVCPAPGDFFRYTRVNDKISFIEGIIGACSHGSQNGWSFMTCTNL